MYCTKCGEKNPESAKFCVKCGNPLPVGGNYRNIGGNPLPNGRKLINFRNNRTGQTVFLRKAANKKTAAAGVIAIIVIAALAFLILGGRSSDAVIKKYVESSMKCDAEAIWNLFPEEIQQAVMKEAEEEDNLYGEEEVIAYLQEEMEDMVDQIYSTLSSDWDYSWKIEEEEDYDISELRELNQDFRSRGLTGFTADAAKDVEVELTVTSAGNSGSNSVHITLIKIGRKWYLGEALI